MRLISKMSLPCILPTKTWAKSPCRMRPWDWVAVYLSSPTGSPGRTVTAVGSRQSANAWRAAILSSLRRNPCPDGSIWGQRRCSTASLWPELQLETCHTLQPCQGNPPAVLHLWHLPVGQIDQQHVAHLPLGLHLKATGPGHLPISCAYLGQGFALQWESRLSLSAVVSGYRKACSAFSKFIQQEFSGAPSEPGPGPVMLGTQWWLMKT